MRNAVLGTGTVLLVIVLAIWLRPDRTSPPATASSSSLTSAPADAANGEPGSRSHGDQTFEERVAAQQDLPSQLEPPPGCTAYRVRVIDPEHQPIPGATASTFACDPAHTAQTDAEGYCRLFVPRGTDPLPVRVEHGERHIQTFCRVQEEVIIALGWAGPLHGQLVDHETGAPIGKATITNHHSFCKDCPPDVVRSRDDGSFTFASMPRGRPVSLAIQAEGYAQVFEQREFGGRGQAIDCTFRLRRGVTIRGRFVDAKTGEPVTTARLTWQGRRSKARLRDGRFCVQVLPDREGTVRFHVVADGYCHHRIEERVEELRADRERDYRLVRSTEIAGIVRDTRGTPIPGVLVQQQTMRRRTAPGQPPNCVLWASDSFLSARSDAAGRFVIQGLVPHAQHILQPRHPDYKLPKNSREAHTVWTTPGQPEAALTLLARPPIAGIGTLRGTYRCNGQPTPAHLQWHCLGRDGRYSVGPDGRFELTGIPAGVVQLTVIPHRYRRVFGTTAEVLQKELAAHITPGQATTIAIEHVIAESEIAGRVQLADGSPAARRTVTLSASELSGLTAQTDDRGKYRARVPNAAASFFVSTRHADIVRGHPGDTNVDLVLKELLELRCRTTDSAGANLPVSILSWTKGAKHPRELSLVSERDEQDYRKVLLAKGDYRLFLIGPGHAPSTRKLILHGNQSLDVVLHQGASVTLRLPPNADGPDRPVRIHLVERFPGGAELPPLANADLQRRIRISAHDRQGTIHHIGPGTHRLVIEDSKLEVVPDKVHVGNTDVTLAVRLRKKSRKAK